MGFNSAFKGLIGLRRQCTAARNPYVGLQNIHGE